MREVVTNEIQFYDAEKFEEEKEEEETSSLARVRERGSRWRG